MSDPKDIVYLYPKTSCPCADWCDVKSEPKNGFETSRGVTTCQTPEEYECSGRVNFGESIQPRDTQGYYELNPQVYTQKESPYFNKVKCGKNNGCPNPSYISWDPRLYSGSHNQYMLLDRPPMNGDVRLKDVYSPGLTYYGGGFEQYKDMRDGQITYYVDRSIEDSFFKPVFSEKAIEKSVMFKDPMGSLKPEYNRYPIINTNNPTVTQAVDYPYCLSFIQDTQSFREDLFSLQMRKRNQERWMPRWVSSYTT